MRVVLCKWYLIYCTRKYMNKHFFSKCRTKNIALYPITVHVAFTGGGTDDATKKHLHVKTYISPWEKAMKGDETLIATLKTAMPGPTPHKDHPKYKCFNRYFLYLTLSVLQYVTKQQKTSVFNNSLTLLCQECHALWWF